MDHVYINAIRKASELRLKLGLDLTEPINIYDVCATLGLIVQFVNIDMEGLYINNNGNVKILISCLRPFPRRVFTCGHELGHHVFNHGLKVDILSKEVENYPFKSEDEKVADAFSAALLMPIAGIQVEFNQRNLNFISALPIDYYAVSSVFGVGYQTLITHCKVNNLIGNLKANELLKFTPATIFKTYFGSVPEKSYFKILNGMTQSKPIDLEVSNYLVLPADFVVEDEFLEKKQETNQGIVYFAMKAGISSIHSSKTQISYFVRIQRQNYFGFAEYRHLEN